MRVVNIYKSFLVGLVLLAPSLLAEAKSAVIFRRHGLQIRQDEVAALEKQLGGVDLDVFEPHEGSKRRYRGLPTTKLLDYVYGASWRSGSELVFICEDGYQAAVPAQRLLEGPSLLATAKVGGEFQLRNSLQNNELVQLGPLYLVWAERPGLPRSELLSNDWPYRIIAIDLVDLDRRYPMSSPPKEANAKVQHGFMLFRQICMKCHTLNGEGGQKAAELNYPVSVTEYWQRDWLRKWVLDPRAVRLNSSMPGLAAMDHHAEQSVDDILLYLEAMAKVKRLRGH